MTVQLVSNGRVIASAPADRFRADLEAAAKRNGRCAFRFAIGRLGLPEAPAQLQLMTDGQPLGEPIALDADFIAAANRFGARLPAGEDATTDPAALSDRPLTTLPLQLGGPAGIAGWIDRFDETGVGGWAYDPSAPPGSAPIELVVRLNSKPVATLAAAHWREDLAELRQGDGRAGIKSPPPPHLLDGQRRALEITLGENGPPVLDQPLVVQLPATTLWPPGGKTSATAPGPRRRLIPRPPQLSIIVLFYNMQREAERTLTSLSRRYQLGVEELDYEVLCIDNGSKTPLDPDWIASFGPEFRLVRPSRTLPSPCFAMNEAAAQARGKRIALMIDGAHVLSPGALREAMAAFEEDPAAVVGLRQWFFGGDQRWFSANGYTREQEDIAFARIGWPNSGYHIFDVSSPMMSTPSPWFDAVSESNCLFMTTELFRRLGGYDEAFTMPGGGVSNLDLFSRAVAASGNTATMLIGEASFHQFHGGTTTNIDEDAKDVEVRSYMNDFARMRGKRLKHLETARLRLRGHMPTPHAFNTRQRPVVRGFLGVTNRIRPTDPHLHFDEGTSEYLNGYAVEIGLPQQTRWLGETTGVAAGDLVNLQEIVGAIRPSRIVAVNLERGLVRYLAGQIGLHALADTRLIQVARDEEDIFLDSDVDVVRASSGPSHGPTQLAAVRELVGLAEHIVVVVRPDPDDAVPVEALRAWMRFVSPRSYLVVVGTATGQPWLGYSRRWWRKAVQLLTGPGQVFSVDHSFERHLVTACPWGYLRHTGGRQDFDDAIYKPAIDDLSTV